MSKMDSWIIIFIVSFLAINIIVFIVGYKINQLPYFIAILNIVISSLSIIYWIIKNLNVQHLHIELREIITLIVEVFIVGFAILCLLTKQEKLATNIVNYLGFSIKFLAGLGMLIFMLTYKMNRLI